MKHPKRVLTQPASEKECAPIGLINFSNGRCAEQWTGSSRNGSVSSKQSSQLSSALAHWRVIGSSSTGVPFDFVIGYWRYIIVDGTMSAHASEFADTMCADQVPIGSSASAVWAKEMPSGWIFAKKASWAVRGRERATEIIQGVPFRTVKPELRPDYLHAVRTRSHFVCTLFACGAMTALKPNSTTAC